MFRVLIPRLEFSQHDLFYFLLKKRYTYTANVMERFLNGPELVQMVHKFLLQQFDPFDLEPIRHTMSPSKGICSKIIAEVED